MTLRLTILPRAEEDVQHIYGYICNRSSQGASAWCAAFEHATKRLADEVPQFGLAPENELVDSELRQALFKTRHGRTYRIVFTCVGDELRILRVRGPGQPPLRADEMPDNE